MQQWCTYRGSQTSIPFEFVIWVATCEMLRCADSIVHSWLPLSDQLFRKLVGCWTAFSLLYVLQM